MTDLTELVEPLKRELAVPGTFASVFPDTNDDALAATLADGFSEARLQGFFPAVTLDPDTLETDPDLSAAGGALIVLFASMRVLRAQIRAMSSTEKYKAGPVEYETGRAASLLKAELDFMRARLEQLIADGRSARAPLATVVDAYIARTAQQLTAAGFGGFYDYEWK